MLPKYCKNEKKVVTLRQIFKKVKKNLINMENIEPQIDQNTNIEQEVVLSESEIQAQRRAALLAPFFCSYQNFVLLPNCSQD